MKAWMPIAFTILFLSLSCSQKEGGFSEPPPVDTTTSEYDRIVILSGDANTRSVSIYLTDGSFDRIAYDYRTDLGTPRGIATFDTDSILVALDNTDRVSRVFWKGSRQGEEEQFALSGLGGQIFDLEKDSLGNYLVLEANSGIERYDATGARVGSPYIPTTLGSCTLSNPRNMFMTSSDQLIVTNQGATDQILVYDVSTLTPSCVSATNFGNNPYGVVLHSDGNLYVTTQGDDQIYRADADGSNSTVIWATDTSRINNPTAIVELPNGNLAVASSATDEVWEMDTSGNLIGTTPLIRDPLSLNITDIRVVLGAEQ